jgi:membrane associated rhomboid family serine protease
MFPVADVIPSRTTPWMTVALIAANVLAFLYALSLPAADAYAWTQRFRVSSRSKHPGQRRTTSLFLHENSVHLALNVIVLWGLR